MTRGRPPGTTVHLEKTPREKPERRKKRYVLLTRMDMAKLGISFMMQRFGGNEVFIPTYPEYIMPAHLRYTPEQKVQMAELMLQGAVWCQCGRNHFLAVLPVQMLRDRPRSS